MFTKNGYFYPLFSGNQAGIFEKKRTLRGYN